MLWLCLPLFSIAFAIRVKVNRGHTWGTPDEKTYTTYAQTWRPGAPYLPFIQKFLGSKELDDIPPTRYGFYALCAGLVAVLKSHPFRTVTWVAAVAGALASPVSFAITGSLPAAVLVGTSALSLTLSRRAFQDTFAALALMLGLWAIHLQSVGLLFVSAWLALATREALLLYLPSLYLAWLVARGSWLSGGIALSLSGVSAVTIYHLLGGRQVLDVFRKLRQPTDYVRRFQSGLPHRVLVDLLMVSPVTMVGAFVAVPFSPGWLVCFVMGALGTHAFITPKNVRFILVVDLGTRMLCAWLPGPWPWVVLILGSLSDLALYRVFGRTKDPVSYNLLVATRMYSEK
jgi:hypothetical protein